MRHDGHRDEAHMSSCSCDRLFDIWVYDVQRNHYHHQNVHILEDVFFPKVLHFLSINSEEMVGSEMSMVAAKAMVRDRSTHFTRKF